MSRSALPLLPRAIADAASDTVQTDDVRDALEAIRREAASGSDPIALERFWRAAGEPHPSVRRTWIAAELAEIERLLEVLPVAAE